MTGYLICEDGPLSERIFTFDEGNDWVIGRDEDLCTFVLEDPMVSRKHLTISLDENNFYIKNESSTNPTLLNDQDIEDTMLLKENDLVQIGNNTFRFTTSLPQKNEEEKEFKEEEKVAEKPEPLTLGSFPAHEGSSKWMIKVIAGPAIAAFFSLNPGFSYVIGSDSDSSDIILHDLSISKNHARITLSKDGEAAIIDLKSKNGVIVNGKKIEVDTLLEPGDIITLGTTSLLFIDAEKTRETIYSPGITHPHVSEKSIFEEQAEEKPVEEVVKTWKDTFIPTKHLAVASIFSVFICIGFISLLALFKSSEVTTPTIDETKEIASALSHFENVQFNYNSGTSTLFLTGHVLTDIDYNELMYRLNNIPYIATIDNNLIIDESVYDNINQMLLKNPAWQSILMTARSPGHFILTGYIKDEGEKVALTDFLNKYFVYLNLLDNQVVVEDTLNTQIENLLISNGFANVVFQQNNGRVVLSGRAHEIHKDLFDKVALELEGVHGIRVVKNFVIFTTQSSAAMDITGKYKITGSSKFGNKSQFVLIDGKILGVNDKLDGMIITDILEQEVLLKKDGVKYKIDFND